MASLAVAMAGEASSSQTSESQGCARQGSAAGQHWVRDVGRVGNFNANGQAAAVLERHVRAFLGRHGGIPDGTLSVRPTRAAQRSGQEPAGNPARGPPAAPRAVSRTTAPNWMPHSLRGRSSLRHCRAPKRCWNSTSRPERSASAALRLNTESRPLKRQAQATFQVASRSQAKREAPPDRRRSPESTEKDRPHEPARPPRSPALQAPTPT